MSLLHLSDIDECADRTDLCNREELTGCVDTDGGYECVCADGYTKIDPLDPYTCTGMCPV